MRKTLLALLCLMATTALWAQERLYRNTFPLGKVQLLDGPFKHACDLNVKTLLAYDTDRLLAPYLKEAGLPKKAELFPNWEGLDGHVGGHYLSALAIHYAVTGDPRLKERMDYMISELKRCQQANGDGYLSGIPNGKDLWNDIKQGNVGSIWKYWAPWYNIHKTYAGLRDAWLYAGNEEAKKMFLDLCDWGLTVIAPLNDQQMEQMLENEFGGMDEMYADAYQMTGDLKYLDGAKRFSHHWLLDSMVKGVDNLDNKHANTQVPKAVGYLRIAELSEQAGRHEDAVTYRKAAEFFWQTVVNNRSLALGGNSRREHFASAADCHSYVEDREGPESCNTYNMMKLTEGLFRVEPDARYADFYERAMLNHILSTQHPVHGGYVYFTSARPAHYRVYSAPNSAMWCCVGTGMENHGKYGEFIYTHQGDSLWVNLFVASKLSWDEQGMTITQETQFPYEETVKLTVNTKKSRKAKLLIRKPSWCKDGEMKVVCQSKDYAAEGTPQNGYILIDRKWKNGDVVEITMPMHVRLEPLVNVPEYVAIMRGPVLLSCKMGTQGLDGLVADDGRWAHIAHGPLVSLFDTPALIGERDQLQASLEQMKPVPGKPLHFTVDNLFSLKGEKIPSLELEPFFSLHDSRYMMYWLSMDEQAYANMMQAREEAEKQKLELDRRTVDMVTPGEQQPEVDHKAKHDKSNTGYFQDQPYRDATNGGYFQYEMATQGLTDLTLAVGYWGNETGGREFTILVDGQPLAEESLGGKWNRQAMVTQEYPIPAEMLKDKSYVTITFQAKPGKIAGGVYSVRLVKPAQ